MTEKRSPFLFILIGLLGGLLSGAFGVGGGIMMVPLLIGLGKVHPKAASGMSLAAIVPSSIVGSIRYGVDDHVHFIAALILGAGGIIGAMIGTRLLRKIKVQPLRWAFILILILVAVQLLFSVPARTGSGEITGSTIVSLVAVGMIIGIASGLFGIGGGVLAVPALMALFGFTDLLAKGTSLLAMVFTATSGTFQNARSGNVLLKPALMMGVAAAVASLLGTQLAYLMDPRLSNILFAALLAVSIFQLSLRAIQARRLGEQ